MIKRSTIKNRKAKQRQKRSLADRHKATSDEPKDAPHANATQANEQQTPAAVKGDDETIHGKSGQDKSQQNINTKEKNWPQRVEAACAVLLVFITGLYTYYAKQQAKASTEASIAATNSLNTIRTQFQLDQRPVLSIQNFWLTDLKDHHIVLPKKGEPIVVTTRVKNVGKSTAFYVVFHQHVLFGKHISELKVDFSDEGIPQMVIDQGMEVISTAYTLKDSYKHDRLPSDKLDWDGSYPVFIAGQISYRDRFDNRYCSPFAAVLLENGAWTRVPNFGSTTNIHAVDDFCPGAKY